ncbi:MAG: hypothetical protein HOH04_16790 [Rhodospirillaceae bacterium]|nr:hypothetical protein [Rhodospirillaceae bacterium]
MDRKTKNVVLNCEEEFGPEWNWMPKKLIDLIPWAEKYLELVPEEYRDSTILEVVSFLESHRDNSLNVKVHYSRPETNDELKTRLAVEETQKLEQQETERLKLEELKAKFNDR